MMCKIINDGDLSVAFVRSGLVEVGEASIQIEDKIYTAVYRDGSTIVTESDRTLPGYHEMWFSWITHNQNTKDIWGIED